MFDETASMERIFPLGPCMPTCLLHACNHPYAPYAPMRLMRSQAQLLLGALTLAQRDGLRLNLALSLEQCQNNH